MSTQDPHTNDAAQADEAHVLEAATDLDPRETAGIVGGVGDPNNRPGLGDPNNKIANVAIIAINQR